MPISTPEPTIKFDDIQNEQLAQYGKRLLVLQNDISIATSVLADARKESEQIQKSNQYQAQLLVEAEQKTTNAQAKLKDLQDRIDQSELILDTNIQQNKKIVEDNAVKSKELVSRETALEQGEEELKTKVEDFNSQHSQLLKDQLSIQAAKDAFLKATETVQWPS